MKKGLYGITTFEKAEE